MAYSTISKPSLHFNTKLRSGVSSGTQANTGVGFQPDLIWDKNRASGVHAWWDAVRGNTKQLQSNSTGAETTVTQLASFDSDGFTINGGSDHGSGTNIVDWCWKAGTTGSGNTGGSGTYKTYNYSANTTAGFSIIKYTGNGTSGHTIPHHLGAVPFIVIVKRLENTRHWCVGHASEGWTKAGFLSATDSWSAYDYWNNANPTSTSIALSSSVAVNSNDETYIMYIFTEKTGYSKFGSYTGNGNADGAFIYTGFKPALIIMKRSDASGNNWRIFDNKRSTSGFNVIDKTLRPNTTDAETSSNIDFVSNGVKIRNTDGEANTSGGTYIYMAFAEEPLVANVGASIPATAR